MATLSSNTSDESRPAHLGPGLPPLDGCCRTGKHGPCCREAPVQVSFDAHPDTYRHWRLRIDGEIAWLSMDVDAGGGLTPGYELKLNSYDLGVDIELYDAVQRLRFEHPEVRAVVVTSAKDRVFCSGANIRMLAQSSHQWKVNFCKFTNETRNGMEDATEHSGQVYLAAVNGSCAGGGYEIALACERILLIDDSSSAVAMPEVALLGVLPGTGGLTRLVDKRGVRKDRADVFATRSDGIRGRTAADRRQGHCPGATAADRERRRAGLRPRDGGAGPRRRGRHRHGARPGRAGARERGRGARTSRRLDARGDPAARRPAPAPAHQRTAAGHLGAAQRRRPRRGPRPRTRGRRQRRDRLAVQRDPAVRQAHAQAARRDQPQPDRAHRAGQLLRRLADRRGASRPSTVHVGP